MIMNGYKISVVITNLNDKRIKGLIETLENQNPFEIIVADGGSTKEHIELLNSIKINQLKIYILEGSIAVTRSKVVSKINGDITVFIDTDEIPASSDWLKKIIQPIADGCADFVFGPTKPFEDPKNRIERYFNSYDRWFYENIVPNDVSKGPMGNSAWRTDLLKTIGFDVGLSIGGEDYDVNLRSLAAGYRGKFVKDAVVYHDQSGIRTLRRFTKKMFWNYLVGASLAYKKNKVRVEKFLPSVSGSSWKGDPLEIFVLILKPFAFITSQILSLDYLRRKNSN